MEKRYVMPILLRDCITVLVDDYIIIVVHTSCKTQISMMFINKYVVIIYIFGLWRVKHQTRMGPIIMWTVFGMTETAGPDFKANVWGKSYFREDLCCYSKGCCECLTFPSPFRLIFWHWPKLPLPIVSSTT